MNIYSHSHNNDNDPAKQKNIQLLFQDVSIHVQKTIYIFIHLYMS